MSVPWPIQPMPLAVAEAAPPEDPPGVILLLWGLNVWPWSELLVNHLILKAGVLVLPIIIAPAFSKLSTTVLFLFAIKDLFNRKPFVDAKPVWSVLILTVTGTPAKQPNGLFFFLLSSKSFACFLAYSKVDTGIALILGLTWLNLSSSELIISSKDISLER